MIRRPIPGSILEQLLDGQVKKHYRQRGSQVVMTLDVDTNPLVAPHELAEFLAFKLKVSQDTRDERDRWVWSLKM